MKNEMKNVKFSQIPEISSIFRIFIALFRKYRERFSFPEHFCEIPAKFHYIFAEKSQISSKNENEK